MDVNLWEEITDKNAREILKLTKKFVSYVEDRL